MPRYHFNVYDGHRQVDAEGTVLPTWREAGREAVRLAGRILHDDAETLRLGSEWKMEVTDSVGLILFRLDVCFTASPAITHAAGNDV